MPDLKLLKFPGPLGPGARDNLARAVRSARNGNARRMICAYELKDGTAIGFKAGMTSSQAVAFCEQLKLMILKDWPN